MSVCVPLCDLVYSVLFAPCGWGDEYKQALIQSGQDVPVALSQMAAEFRNQCNLGFAQKKKRGGFGGKGFTFHVSERSRQQLQMQAAKKELAGVTEADEVEEVELLLQRDDILGPPPSAASAATSGAAVASAINAALAASSPAALQSAVEEAAAKAALLAKHQLATGGEGGPVTLSSTEAVARVKLVAKVLKLQDEELAKRPPEVPPPPPYGLPPPGCFKTNMTIDEMVREASWARRGAAAGLSHCSGEASSPFVFFFLSGFAHGPTGAKEHSS